MLNVPLFDLRGVTDKKKLLELSNLVINSDKHILGDNVKLFEKNFANYIGTKYCIGVANGTDALIIALRSLEVDSNSNVACVANAGFYSSTAINQIGANVIYIDVDRSSMLLDIDDLVKNLKNHKIDVLIVTHLYGQVVQMNEIIQLSKQYKFKILEDCAQSHGSKFEGKKTGSFGDVAAFSFYPTKNLGAVGDAGAVLTSNEEIANKLISLRQYGWTEKYQVNYKFGINSRLDEIQASFLNFKLQFLEKWNQERLAIAKTYVNNFTQLPIKISDEVLKGVCHLFVVQVENRKDFMEYLKNNGVQTAIHYPIPDHKQPININKFSNISLEATEDIVQNIVTLPLYPGMGEEKVEHTIQTIRKFYQNK